MCIDPETLARYVVTVREGERLAHAVARHRESTGHGGMCVIVFESKKGQRARKLAGRRAAVAA